MDKYYESESDVSMLSTSPSPPPEFGRSIANRRIHIQGEASTPLLPASRINHRPVSTSGAVQLRYSTSGSERMSDGDEESSDTAGDMSVAGLTRVNSTDSFTEAGSVTGQQNLHRVENTSDGQIRSESTSDGGTTPEAGSINTEDLEEYPEYTDITKTTRAALYQYIIPLDPPHSNGESHIPREAFAAYLEAHPINFVWKPYDSFSPRKGRFRLATSMDLAVPQLPKLFQDSFQFQAVKNSPPPVKITSLMAWRRQLLSCSDKGLIFIMEWTTADPDVGKDPGAGLGVAEETGYAGAMLAACVISLGNWDPVELKTDYSQPPKMQNEKIATSPYHFSTQPIEFMALRGEFTYDEQRGLGDNPMGIRTGFRNIPSSERKKLGTGSGIYVRKTKIGGVQFNNQNGLGRGLRGMEF